MKRTVVVLAAGIGGLLVGAHAAQAEVTANDSVTLAFAGYVGCANGGAGEIVSGTVDVHVLSTSTVNDNGGSARFHFQPQGGSMVGAITGDTYRVTGVTQYRSNESLQNDRYTQTYVNEFHLIGPGPANNFVAREVAHLTIDANGDVVAEHDDLSLDCG